MCIYTEHIRNTISQHIDLKSKNKSLSGPMGVGLATGWVVAGEGSQKQQQAPRSCSPFSKVDNEHMNKKKSKKCQGARHNCKTYGSFVRRKSCGGFFGGVDKKTLKQWVLRPYFVVEFLLSPGFFFKIICVWRWYCQADMAIHVVIAKLCFDGILFRHSRSWTENH